MSHNTHRPYWIVSPMLFAAIIVAFALPFVTVSCDGETAHASGLELATGSVPGANGLECPDETVNSFSSAPVDPEPSCNTAQKLENEGTPFALIAFLCAIAGLLVSFIPRAGRRHRERLPLIIVTLLGGGSLGLGLIDAGFSAADVNLELGFWVALSLFSGLFCGYVFGLLPRRLSQRRLTGPAVPGGIPSTAVRDGIAAPEKRSGP
jgi:hypothetical protein